MAKQQYKNHVRYYTPHHFIFYPVLMILFFICARHYWQDPQHNTEWLMMAILVALVCALSFMTRQHYALMNQDRIVRLEMRLRYFQLTQKSFQPLEKQLSFKQVAALRFAGDHELVSLIDKTLAENLSPTDIKKLVTDWQEDHMRV